MYVVFDLRMGVAAYHEIESGIQDWATRYQVPYKTKVHKNTLRLGLDDARHFTLFFTTWTGTPYRVIVP